MSLSKYLKIAFKWWWLVLISAAITGAGMYVYTKRQPKIYAAKATLMVGSSVFESLNPDQKSLMLSQTLAEVYAELAKREIVTRGVIERNKLDMAPAVLSGMVGTSVNPTAQLLEIIITDLEPERAAFLANAIAEELILQSPTNSPEQVQRETFLNAQLKGLQEKIAKLDEDIKKYQQTIDNAQSATERDEARTQIKDLESLKSEYQNSYGSLSASTSTSSINRLQILERATPNPNPVGPNLNKNVGMAVVAGIALAIVGIIMLEFFDDTLTWQGEDMTSIANVPVLGAMGKVTKDDTKIVAHDKIWSPEANALRSLRDNIFLATEGKQFSTLLITSPLLGEGKSFVTSNLAFTIASSYSNIVTDSNATNTTIMLVDADLRKPSLHEIFDLPNLVGLSDVLIAPEHEIEMVLKQALRQTALPNLLLLPAGRTPIDPGSLLNSLRFNEVIKYLSARSKLVVIDSAPILEAVETRAIENVVDYALLVVSSGRTRKKVVEMTAEYFHSKRRNTLLGLVFNRVKLPYGQEYTPGQGVQPLSGDKFQLKKTRQSRSGTLTLSEVALQLGVKKETVRKWCEEGRIPGIKTGDRWKVRGEDLDEYITLYKLSNTEVDKMLSKEPKPKTTAPAAGIGGNGSGSFHDEPPQEDLIRLGPAETSRSIVKFGE